MALPAQNFSSNYQFESNDEIYNKLHQETSKNGELLEKLVKSSINFERKVNEERISQGKRVVCLGCNKEGHSIQSCYGIFPTKRKDGGGRQENRPRNNKFNGKKKAFPAWSRDSQSSSEEVDLGGGKDKEVAMHAQKDTSEASSRANKVVLNESSREQDDVLCESCDESCDPLANDNESYNVKMLKELLLKANLELIDKNAQVEKLQQKVNTLENKLKGVENSNLSKDNLELKKAHPWASKFIRPSNYKTTVDFEKMNQGQGPHDKTGLGYKEDEDQQKEKPNVAQAKGKGPNHAYKYHPRYTNHRNRKFNRRNSYYNYNQRHRTYQPKFYENGYQRYMRDSRDQYDFYPRQRTPHHYRPRPQHPRRYYGRGDEFQHYMPKLYHNPSPRRYYGQPNRFQKFTQPPSFSKNIFTQKPTYLCTFCNKVGHLDKFCKMRKGKVQMPLDIPSCSGTKPNN